jgi:hypothetical protein
MRLIKAFGIFATVLLLSACNFDTIVGQVKGNGTLVKEERRVSEKFSEIKGSSGLDIYLTEGFENKITVEADENLLEIIETSINKGRLNISTKKNIGRATAKRCM